MQRAQPGQQSPHQERCLDALIALKNYQAEYDIGIGNDCIPFFYTMGSQNTGKTLLVEFLTDIPLGFSDGHIATKCPVEYTLICDPSLQEPDVQFQGERVTAHDLRRRVQEHMQNIPEISHSIVKVRITAPKVRQMVFVDLPGFCNKDFELEIRNLALTYMRKRDAFALYVVAPSDKDVTADSGITNLFQLARDAGVIMTPENFLIVINKIDTQWELLRPRQTEFVDDYVFKTLGDPIKNNYMLICLNPAGIKLTEQTFDERKQFLDQIATVESKFFDEKLRPNLKYLHDYKERVGVEKVRQILERRLRDMFMPHIHILLDAVNNHRRKLQTKLDQLKIMQGDHSTPSATRPVEFFVETLLSLVNVSTSSSMHDDTAMNLSDMLKAACTRADLESADASKKNKSTGGGGKPFALAEKWPYALDMEDIERVLCKDYSNRSMPRDSVHLLSQFDTKMIGAACFKQARMYLEVCALASPFFTKTTTAIHSIGHSSRTGGFNVTEVVRQTVHGQIDGLIHGVDVFVEIISCILANYTRAALRETCLNPEFSSIDGLHSIMRRVADAVEDHFETRHLQKIRERWVSTIDLYKSFFPVDVSVRSLLLTMHSPPADMIFEPVTHLTSSKESAGLKKQREVALSKVRLQSPRGATSVASEVAEVRINQILSTFEECPREKFRNIVREKIKGLLPSASEITRSEIVNNVEAAWQSGNRDAVKVILEDAVLEQYKPSTTSNDMIIETEGKDECKTNVHSHSCKKIELLKKIRQVTAEARSSLSLADVVQGDFQGPKQSAAATAKIPYMQSCAMEYYNLFVGQILFDFEAAVQNHVYAPFENVLKFGEGVKEALGFPVSEDALGNTVALQLIKSMSDRRTDIQEEIDEAQAQLSQAEQAITKLEHAIAQW